MIRSGVRGKEPARQSRIKSVQGKLGVRTVARPGNDGSNTAHKCLKGLIRMRGDNLTKWWTKLEGEIRASGRGTGDKLRRFFA